MTGLTIPRIVRSQLMNEIREFLDRLEHQARKADVDTKVLARLVNKSVKDTQKKYQCRAS